MKRRFARSVATTIAISLTLALWGCATETPKTDAASNAAAWDAAAAGAQSASGTVEATAVPVTSESAGATSAAAPAAAAAAGAKGTAAAGTQAKVASVNSPTLVGSWTITVVGADRQPLDPKGNAASSGQTILQIDTTAANNSTTPLKSPPGDYKLVDSAGTAMKLASSDPGMGYNEGTGADPVAVGTEAMFSMAYVVPSGAKGFTLVFAPSTGAKGVLKVSIP